MKRAAGAQEGTTARFLFKIKLIQLEYLKISNLGLEFSPIQG